MSDPKNFLERWSRRKLDTSDSPDPSSAEKTGAAASEASQPPVAEFDPATLPPLESITASSDIRAFLQTGVPQALAQAALRRAWSADPAIRDFVGLSENSWDFNNPSSIPGFGPIEPENIQQAAKQFLGEPKVPAPETKSPAPPAMRESVDDAPTNAKIDGAQRQRNEDSGKIETASTEDGDGAAQHNESQSDRPEGPPLPRHGGALPE